MFLFEFKIFVDLPQNIRKFTDQFLKVRKLLDPVMPTKDGGASGYDVNVEFRANTADELEGSKIIEWVLSTGRNSLRQNDKLKSIYWEPGQSISLSLRVAKDSPLYPQTEGSQSSAIVNDRIISFHYNDPWAMFSLINNHIEPDRNNRSEIRSQLLRFEFPMVAQLKDGTPLQAETKARVYIRLSLSPVGKRNLLNWPVPFPAMAPEWVNP